MKCQICGKKFQNLSAHIRTHNISGKEYKAKFDVNSLREFTDIHRERLSKAMKGKQNFLGHHHSSETREKMSESKKGDKNPAKREEVREKISRTLRGRHLSPSTEFDGSLKYWKGKKRSKKTKEKIKQARLKQVIPKKDTSIEIALQEELKKRNIDFETHKELIGQPDIFIEPNICIFADGDYWHNLPEAKVRDEEVNSKLEERGFKILRFSENEINSRIKVCVEKILEVIS